MNIQNGFFRIWVTTSILFVVVVLTFSFTKLYSEFNDYYFLSPYIEDSSIMMIPVKWDETRGEQKKDYTCGLQELNSDNPFEKFAVCWYEIDVFRKFYPEYNNISDKKISDALYKKAGIQTDPINPWASLFKVLVIAFTFPLLTLLIGKALFWICDGFKRSK